MAIGDDELWARAAEQVRRARGWSLRPLARLGRPRPGRRTWLAEGAAGTVVVKASANPHAAARAAWVAEALSLLAARGCPVPEVLWHGRLDARWWLVVQSRLPGEPLRTLDRSALDQVLALVERQAEPAIGVEGGWDFSWWIGVVLFEGWERWWEAATAGRRRPAGGDRLVRRIVEVAGDEGLRCAVGYAAVARLGLTAQRREPDDFETWRQVTDAVLDALG